MENLELELLKGLEDSSNAKELYEITSTYNAYTILFLKLKNEFENKNYIINNYYSNSLCYKNSIESLFSIFNNNECLKVTHLNATNHDKDMLFLLDNDTLLRLNSFDINNSWIINSSNISYNILKLYNCKAKIYNQLIFSRDPYYCYTDYKNKDAFGLFNSNTQITPAYEVNKEIELYNNMDIQDIIKPMSIDEIFHKINEQKKAKVKSLFLAKEQI